MCGPRYSGRLCQYCSEGHYPVSGFEYCKKCFDDPLHNSLFIWSSTLLVFVLWFLLAVAINSITVEILLQYLQMVNMIQVNKNSVKTIYHACSFSLPLFQPRAHACTNTRLHKQARSCMHTVF